MFVWRRLGLEVGLGAGTAVKGRREEILSLVLESQAGGLMLVVFATNSFFASGSLLLAFLSD